MTKAGLTENRLRAVYALNAAAPFSSGEFFGLVQVSLPEADSKSSLPLEAGALIV